MKNLGIIFSFVVIGASLLTFVFVLSKQNESEMVSENKYIEDFHASSTEVDVQETEKEVGVTEEEEDQRKIAYKIGYKKGYNNFMKTSVDIKDEESIIEYTSNKEEIVNSETEIIQEIMMRGYVDGYHKAGESLYCPRTH